MTSSIRINSKYSSLLTAITAALIVLGTINSIFSIAALLLCIFNIIVSNEESSMSMLMFLLPFSNIFMLSPTSQSFFTYITLFYVLYLLFVNRKLSKKFLVLFFAFISIILIQALLSFNVLRFIKLIANVLLIYFAMNLNPEKSHKSIFLSFILGAVASSLISMPGVFPSISDYISTKSLGQSNDWQLRFAGMYGDPNYYSVNILVSLCIIVLLWHRKEIKPLFAIGLSMLLLYFSIITYSKSAFLMLVFPLILFLYSNVNNKKYFFATIFTVGAIFLVFLVLANKIDAFSIVLSRFQTSSGDITTGRSTLWKNYLSTIAENPLLLLLGHGIGANLVGEKGAHNTYIDFLYYLGLAGTIIFILVLVSIPKFQIKDKKKNVFNYSMFICIGAMYFFLSEIFYVDFPFHIIIALIVYNLPLDKNQKVGNLR